MTEKLKPCPFCGGEVKNETKTFRDRYGLYKIMFFKCSNKDCSAVISFDNTKSYGNYMEAVKNWNRRV